MFSLAHVLNLKSVTNSLVHSNKGIGAADGQGRVADRRHHFLQFLIHCQKVVYDIFCHLFGVQTVSQGRTLRSDARRAQTGIAGITTSQIVTDAAGHLEYEFTGRDPIGPETHHFEGVCSQVSGFTQTAGGPQRYLTLATLGYSSEITVPQFAYNGVSCMIQRHFMGGGCTTINPIEEKATHNVVRIAYQVVKYRYTCR